MGKKKKHIVFIWLLIPLLTFLSFNYHSKAKYKTYKHVIWADQAGYYVYLPSTFIYQFDGHAFPVDIVEETGKGFELTEEGKIKTKYNYGVALLQAPFFFLAHSFANLSDYDADGFSAPYHWAIMLAAIFYCLAGMHLLYLFLCKSVRSNIAFLTVFIILVSTNLYYYTVGQAGMSHAYSFFLFSALILLCHNVITSQKPTYFYWLILAFSLAIIIRPTAVLMLVFLLLYNPKNQRFKVRFNFLIKNKKLLLFSAFIGFSVIIPQLIYWYYASGNLLHYGYTNEGFTNWLSPKIGHVMFSANNGWLVYTPLAAILIYTLLTHKSRAYKYPVIIIFIIGVYLFSSWWSWHFGCAFGARSFVEYLPLLALPFAFRLEKVFYSQKVLQKISWALALIICTYISMKLTYSFDTCYFGQDWEYSSILNELFTF